jgi:hypothetical protein
MSNGNISWGGVKVAGAYGLQTKQLHAPIVVKSVSLRLLESSDPVQGLLFIYLKSNNLVSGEVTNRWSYITFLPCIFVTWTFTINMSLTFVGRDSSVGIATRYGLDGPGLNSRGKRDSAHTSRQILGPIQPIQRVPCLPEGNMAGTWP